MRAADSRLNLLEAARYLGVPVTTLRRWALHGLIRYEVTAEGMATFRVEDLDAVALGDARTHLD